MSEKMDREDDTLRAAQGLLDALDANDAANIHGWSVALRKALAASATDEGRCTCGVNSNDPRYAKGHATWCPARPAVPEALDVGAACWSCGRLYADEAELYCGWCGAKADAALRSEEPA